MIRIYDQSDEDELAVACSQWNEGWWTKSMINVINEDGYFLFSMCILQSSVNIFRNLQKIG